MEHVAKNECMKYDHILSNVSFKCIRHPSSHTPNELCRCTSVGECSCTTHTHGLSSNIRGTVFFKLAKEPGMSGKNHWHEAKVGGEEGTSGPSNKCIFL